MKKIGIFYGTSGSTTLGVVDELEYQLKKEDYQTYNVKDGIEAMKDYENLILITPTYGVGELQPHWQKQYDVLSKIDFHGKVVGLIGLGNQFAFGESFVGALRVLYDVVNKNGGKVVGFVSDKEYSHEETTAVIDGNFVGLPIDETNQGSKTPQRIISWLEVVKKEMK
ncbi:flavodoxin [Fusobacterium necrophorum]|uniref:Flavodoxin n=1 Tax=Fusobacterium necrophorum DJ-2 TaxID=1441737 RepID=A0AB73C206_9FUSO|nr:flavodoxin [Fusobacterium necrophorum]KDE63153.1 flavodoxin [Fusobacterium necrophorum BFTR-1]KDE67740.1 flavodoxin [Fusobacterium necrophorum DJ-1]KDE71694.1 flavodoxin [Fusobacterium necrophorum DJ-2]MBR8823491.1 Flavodoxin [Fusobacterium necrophorum]MCF0162484.1 flavodoxin [Fusobacterium necrophorum]